MNLESPKDLKLPQLSKNADKYMNIFVKSSWLIFTFALLKT
jgi:hypothetical protein